MAITVKHPGVYVEEIRKFPPSVAEVATAIPAFIGYTQIAKDKVDGDLILVPTRITSLLEYEEMFGTAMDEGDKMNVSQSGTQILVTITDPNKHNMYYAIQAYFANGGGPCYVVSVGPMTATGSIDVTKLQDGIAETEKVDEITLLVFPESLGLIAYDDTTTPPTTPTPDVNRYANYAALMNEALASCRRLQDRFTVMDVPPDVSIPTIPAPPGSDKQDVLVSANLFRSFGVGVNDLRYGAAYSPTLETVFNYIYDESSVTLPFLSDMTLADINPSTPPPPGDGTTPPPQENPNANAPVYAQVTQAIDNLPVILPPSSLIVGIYAAVDSTRGVWKAPANVSLSSAIKPSAPISDAIQDDLNVTSSGKSINAIRSFVGKGVLVWGARTLAGNDNEWRYINVRRFFNMVEESVKKATEQFVFEPNDRNTWTRVRGMIENFLLLQWRAGALAGAVPEDAFFVRVGLPETMTSLDILEGRMNVEIGMAVVRPAEFIILKFSHLMQVS